MGRKKRMRQKGRERRRETRNKRKKEERKGDFLLDFKENEQKQMFIKIWWIVLGKVAGLIPPPPKGTDLPFHWCLSNTLTIIKALFPSPHSFECSLS